MNVFPLGAFVMGLKNVAEDRRRCREMADLGLSNLESPRQFLPELLELCGYYEKVFPENAPYWQRAAEYADAHANGTAALENLVERWGFVRNARGDLEVPEWWNGQVVVPLEFMDYSSDRHPAEALRAAAIDPERFHTLARKASDFTWMGYYRVKGSLNLGGVSLLISEVTNAVKAMKKRVEMPKDRPLPIYVIGISEDEIAALRGPDVAVIGFNLGYSPVLEKLVQKRSVLPLMPQRDGPGGTAQLVDAATQEPVRLAGGQCYVCQLDAAKDRLPVPDGSGLAMTNYTLHHNRYPEQAAMIREMHRVALPLAGGGRGWVAAEMFRVPHFPRLIFSTASKCGSTSWDAWVSFANGVACAEELIRRQQEWADENIHLRFTYVPRGLANAPALVHRFIMCQTQVLISGD